MSRLILAALLLAGLTACIGRRDGRDGMDGRGVAAGLACVQKGTC